MLIDWFTVVAQAINFLVLVWLLKRLLFKPVLAAVEERQKKIELQLSEASQARQEAAKSKEASEGEKAEFEAQKSAMMAAARGQASSEREQLIEAARRDADQFREGLWAKLSEEQAVLESEISASIRQRAFSLASRVLEDLASSNLEEQMAARMSERLSKMTTEERRVIESASLGVIVRSTQPLGADSRKKIESALSSKVAVRYETAPTLAGGLELIAGDHCLEWNAKSRLKEIERKCETTERTHPNE